MHHKLLTSRLVYKSNARKRLPRKSLKRVDSISESSSCSESNLTAVAVDHVPLSRSLSHIVSMELGSDPILSPGEKEEMAAPPKKVETTSHKEEHPGQLEPKLSSQGPPGNIYWQARKSEVSAASEQLRHCLSGLQRHHHQQSTSIQMQQIRQLQRSMHSHFLYSHGPAVQAAQSNAAIAYLEVLARQQALASLVSPSATGASAQLQEHSRPNPGRPIPIPESATSTSKRSFEQSEKPNQHQVVVDRSAMEEHQKNKKIKRDSTSSEEAATEDGDSDDDSKSHRFRPYQYEQWTEKFQELVDFSTVKGHCQVPHTYTENPPLARWVKRQRYQYKLKMENKQSTMTDERIRLLEDIGFIWDSHAAAWAEKLNELKYFNKANGDCNVPSTYPINPQLATWVKCQRRQYKLLGDGKTSNMILERIVELEKIGFVWEVRKNWESKN